MSDNVYYAIGIGAVVGLFFLWRGLLNSLLKDNKKFRGTIQLVLGVCLLSCTSTLVLAAYHLSAYQNLTYEEPVATIEFESIENDPQHFAANVTLANGTIRSFELKGDQWQMDARFVKWKTHAVQFGLKPLYQLERLSGRYRNLNQEKTEERTVHELLVNKGVDIWQYFQKFSENLPFVDAEYGSATYLPMIDGARYQVMATSTGLMARIVVPNTNL